MKLISDSYKEMNAELHGRNPLYGSKAYKQAANVVESLKLGEGDVVLDYGCGKGTLAKELKKVGVKVEGYDPAIQMFSKHPSEREGYPFEYVVCMDVLEHVEPDCLDFVLEDIYDSFTKKAFILISTEPSNKKLADGRNAHLIIQGRGYWADRLEDHDFVLEKLVDNREGWYGVCCTK